MVSLVAVTIMTATVGDRKKKEEMRRVVKLSCVFLSECGDY